MFFDIFGRDQGVGEMFDKVAGHGKNVQGVLGGIAGAAAGLGIVKAGEQAVDKFKETAGGAVLLQREMGGTAEDASRLNFALSQTGMSAESTQKGFGIFSKNLVASQKDAKTHAAMVKELGFEYQDAHGKLLPMGDILPQLATKFQSMENGPEKTALAMKLFGKSGADMVPFLNKGGDAIGELMHKSDELGTTLNQGQVDAFKNARAEGREWDATMTGLQVTIGGALLPVMVGLEGFIHGQLVPAITGLTGWFRGLSPELQHVVTVLGAVLIVGGPLVLVIGKFAAAFSSIIGVVNSVKSAMLGLNAVLAANPFILVIIGIAALVAGLIWAYNNVGWFKDFVNTAFKVIQDIITNVINFVVNTLIPIFVAGWTQLASFTTTIFTAIGAFFTAIWSGIVAYVTTVVRIITDIFTGNWGDLWALTQQIFQNIANFINGIWGNVILGVSGFIGNIVGFFQGLPGQILGALSGLGGLLVNIGSQIIDGFLNGLKSSWKGVTDFVGGIADWIAKNKGPESKDRVLLEPHGGWIMGGLNRGLMNSLPDLKATLSVVAGTVVKSMDAAGKAMVLTDSGIPAAAASGITRAPATADIRAALQGMVIYVQNPWGSDYLEAKVDERASRAASTAVNDVATQLGGLRR
ncbi:MAG TPA: phage tail tape measure protein [Arthrobacter sp.]|nr:phage tail tape measure protein [Arthrobacter sp.]